MKQTPSVVLHKGNRHVTVALQDWNANSARYERNGWGLPNFKGVYRADDWQTKQRTVSAPLPANPRIGLVARADEGGLARLSIDICNHVRIHSAMVIKIGYMPSHPELIQAAHTVEIDGEPTDDECREWLSWLDAVIILETPYNWNMINLARSLGVRTVLIPMMEYTNTTLQSMPDVLGLPLDWMRPDAEKLCSVVCDIPMGVDRSRFPFRQRTTAKTFVANVGNYKITEDDRNGVQCLLDAIRAVKALDIKFVINSREALPEINDKRVMVNVATKKQAEPIEGDVLIYPRRYAGLSLPMQEALSQGLPVLMPDMLPQRRFLPAHWLIPCELTKIYLRHLVDFAHVDPADLARMIDDWAGRDIAADSLLANEIANGIDWQHLAPRMVETIIEPNRPRYTDGLKVTPRRVAYLGNFKDPWCTEVHVADSLESLGCTVDRIQESGANSQTVLEAAKRADLLLWTNTHDWGLQISAAEWFAIFAELKAHGIKTVSYHADIYLGINRAHVVTTDNPFFAVDHVFTADGGHQDEFAALGVNHHWLPPGAYHRECRLGERRAALASDLAFVGSYPYPHKEWQYRNRMLAALRERYGARFKCWPLPGGNQIRGQELNDLYASAKIIIGDSLHSPRYWSDRYTETLGRGGFMIAPIIEGIEGYFTPGKHFVGYDHKRGKLTDFSALFETIDHYLAADGERELIRLQGFNHVKENHTFRHRMAELLNVVFDV